MKEQSVTELLQRSEEELYELLAESLFADEEDFFPQPIDRKIERAREHVEQVKRTLVRAVCDNDRIRSAVQSNDRPGLVSLLIEIVGGDRPEVQATLIAVLIAKMGVRRLCADSWRSGD